ncbi:MAG TPA: copper amine oxidase N-terminal domain-containing protein [Fimbriimonadaceae bacterium]|nr:copper amine oxidase N-terminal domain-containing protein [Fimbriimonadaceae bacterium]
MNGPNLSRSLVVAAGLLAVGAYASPPTVLVDGRPVEFPDMQPRFLNDRVMVPLRGVFEQMHANVIWNPQTEKIMCVGDNSTVELRLGDNEARVDGQKIMFDAPATLSHGRTLVPLRFLAQSLGARVRWDNDTQTVRIETPRYERRHERDAPPAR